MLSLPSLRKAGSSGSQFLRKHAGRERATTPRQVAVALAIMVSCFLVAETNARKFAPPPAGLKCGMDAPAYNYPGMWNKTTLRTCTGAVRPEKICIVGGGSSGVHMGWLLKRRGFQNTVLFEQNDRLGGFVWTRQADDQTNVTRELGAAFLSPDYVEVREFLKRYGEKDVPLSVKRMMHFHNTSTTPSPGQVHRPEGNPALHDTAELPSDYYNRWLKSFTGTSDPGVNGKLVGEALDKYYAISAEIFGDYAGRFPPRPKTPQQLQMLKGRRSTF